MQRLTVYIPQNLKRQLEIASKATGRSSSDLIREGIQKVIDDRNLPRLAVPLFESSEPDLAERVEAALEGFGQS